MCHSPLILLNCRPITLALSQYGAVDLMKYRNFGKHELISTIIILPADSQFWLKNICRNGGPLRVPAPLHIHTWWKPHNRRFFCWNYTTSVRQTTGRHGTRQQFIVYAVQTGIAFLNLKISQDNACTNTTLQVRCKLLIWPIACFLRNVMMRRHTMIDC